MKNIVVTGGAGFIGSHLCEYLLNKGEHVICVDNFFTGSRDNIKHLLDNPEFEVIRHDITQPLSLECNQIYNLACPSSPIHYKYNAVRTVQTNVLGVHNMLNLARMNGARILQVSTSEVYGNPLEHPQKEDSLGRVNCISERSCYDEGKRVAETMMMDFHRQYGVDTRIVRLFHTYGPRLALQDGRVVTTFIIQALGNKDITINGDGSQIRSFCYVDDSVEGIYRVMNCDYHLPINIGNPEEYSILHLAKKIIAMIKSKSDIIYRDVLKGEPIKVKPDLSLAKDLLKWEPKIVLDNGLKRTIKYYKERCDLPND